MQYTKLTVNLLAPAGLAFTMLAAPPLGCVDECPNGVDKTDGGGCNGGRESCLASATDTSSETETETGTGTTATTAMTGTGTTETSTTDTEGTATTSMTVDPTEGTTVDTTSTATDSTTGSSCGDGVMDAGEECDDGNDDDTDECTSACMLAVCGDGFVQAGVEECDDGNGDDTDSCLSSCMDATCGDGHVQVGVEECDLGMNNGPGSGCVEDMNGVCMLERRMVFVTSKAWKGDLGGLAGADAKCAALAEGASLNGTFMAWLSDGQVAPSMRFGVNPAFSGPYELVDGTVVANGWAELTSGSLLSTINMDELGVPVSSSAWTNTKADGTKTGGDHCASWTDATGGFKGNLGNSDQVDMHWTEDGSSNCNSANSLYCFQVQ